MSSAESARWAGPVGPAVGKDAADDVGAGVEVIAGAVAATGGEAATGVDVSLKGGAVAGEVG
jgi:hypothetical protein